MCGCSSGASTTLTLNKVASFSENKLRAEEPCDYTIEQVNNWLDKINCYADKALYLTTNITKRRLNIYIGALKSAKNYPSNLCYFKKELQEIENIIIIITATGQC